MRHSQITFHSQRCLNQTMFTRRRSDFLHRVLLSVICLVALCHSGNNSSVRAQDADGDPIKLFERGQDAHAKNNLSAALEFYDQAIELRPEFPEAEYQKATALIALGRRDEAAKSLRRAIELRADWALPQAMLGSLLAEQPGHVSEAEALLKRALELDKNNHGALLSLADLRIKAGDARGAVELLRRATALNEATAADWILRSAAERAAGDLSSAQTSLDRSLQIDNKGVAARQARAAIYVQQGKLPSAIDDLEAARQLSVANKVAARQISLDLAKVYAQAGMIDKAQAILGQPELKDSPEASNILSALANDSEITTEALAALVKQAESDGRNASLLARLGRIYRTRDPALSLDYFRRALEIDARNVDYAVGYASALVQARRFTEAIQVLRRAVEIDPNHYVAHANLATALYEVKNYPAAIAEYQWITQAKPELAATYFFIATAYDYQSMFPEALAAYQTFLSKADAKVNSLEIEKVNLR